ETAQLTPANPQFAEEFGASVDVSGERIAVGAPGFLFGAGGVYVFERDAVTGQWVESALVVDGGVPISNGFGSSVSLSGDRFAAGEEFGGRVVVFQDAPVGWLPLTAFDEADGLIARSVDLLDDRLVAAGGPDSVLASAFGLQSTQSLWSCNPELSAQAGGSHDLNLFAGPEFAGALYAVLGSASGTAPGVPLGSVELPLVFDAYTATTLVLTNQPPFVETFGVLDALGGATAAIELPAGSNPNLAGLELDHAWVAIDFLTAAVTFASQPQGLALVD
ncbi:MAG: hypothetical protein AAFZ65_19740, partial [Planctomycetota bacterium]